MSELDMLQSTSSLATAPLIEDEKSAAQKAEEQKDSQDDFSVAALSKHPGWKQIREMMTQDIEDITMLKAIDMQKYTNEELGEVVRVEHQVAEKLQKYLSKVDEAVRAVGNGRTGT